MIMARQTFNACSEPGEKFILGSNTTVLAVQDNKQK